MLSPCRGYDFRTVLEAISESEIPMPEGGKWANAGMVELPDRQIAWRVLSAEYWGVPQRRKRIFFIADFRKKCAGEILFEPESVSGDIEAGGEARQGTAENSERCAGKTGGGNEVVSTLYAAYGTKWNGNAGAYNGDNFVIDKKNGGKSGTDYLTGWDSQERRVFTDIGVSPTLSGADGGGGRTRRESRRY